jgi:hypothetical protein
LRHIYLALSMLRTLFHINFDVITSAVRIDSLLG